MTQPWALPNLNGLVASTAWLLICATAAAAPTSDWEQAPYRVLVTVAVENASRPAPKQAGDIARHISEQVEQLVAPLWRPEVQLADDAAGRRFCISPQELPWDALSDEQRTFDKLMWLGVQSTPAGCVITCREFDTYTRRWGSQHQRNVAQSSYLEEACFEALTEAFCPLATVTSLPENDAQVQLSFKGSALPLPAEGQRFVTPGEIFQPLLRRTDRSGVLMEDGVAPVPWTYVSTAKEEQGRWLADVHSGIRRPFGIQRGRVEQLAVALRKRPGPTRVRFHARTDEKLPLTGYEVFLDAPDGSPQPLGVTGADGMITIPPPRDGSFSMILLRSEGQVLAKIPIPSGSEAVIETPIADNTARLQAQAEAQVIREQLVDVVARRAIMMARVRALLKSQRVDDARKLMAELDSLPSSTDFARSLDALQKRIPETNDPTVKRSIDKLFTSTRELLGKFLDRRQIIELQTQVNEAQAGGS